ncbi:MAG: sugar phosphate isomerase/epimerase family protein [bacterium]
MKLGFFINAYRYFDIDYCIESLSKYSYQGLELWAKGNLIKPYDDKKEWDRVKELIERNNFEVYAVSAHLDFVTPDADQRKALIHKFLGVLELAEYFGVGRVHTASGGLYQDYPEKLQRKHFLEAMEIIGPAAEKRGLKIGLEMEPEKWLSSPSQLIELIEDRLTPGVFGAVVDLGHAFGIGATPSEYIKELAPWLMQVHVDDVRKTDFPHEHLIPGEGDIDYQAVFATLHEIGYDGWLSMELNRHNDDPDGAAAAADRFMQRHKSAWSD